MRQFYVILGGAEEPLTMTEAQLKVFLEEDSKTYNKRHWLDKSTLDEMEEPIDVDSLDSESGLLTEINPLNPKDLNL